MVQLKKIYRSKKNFKYPETAKKYESFGLKVHIEKNYAQHLGIQDGEYSKIGVEIKNDLLMKF